MTVQINIMMDIWMMGSSNNQSQAARPAVTRVIDSRRNSARQTEKVTANGDWAILEVLPIDIVVAL